MGQVLLLLALMGDTSAQIWDSLLKEYVASNARVDYGRWKRDSTNKLDSYLGALAPAWPASLTNNSRKAALINAYNACMIRWILQNYPVESVWRTRSPFNAARFQVNGAKVSLDDIETKLRSMGDPRIHGALVCSARSCPPLRREAYTEDHVNEQLDDNVRAWLANPSLNEFFPEESVARVSWIFGWYRKDFQAAGSVPRFLAKYGPRDKAAFLSDKNARIRYKTYLWGLNDTTELGSKYTQAQFLLDRAKNAVTKP